MPLLTTSPERLLPKLCDVWYPTDNSSIPIVLLLALYTISHKYYLCIVL